jgi:hypothetical protein
MPERESAWERFWESTHIGYEQWHEGIGYDLGALGEMTAEQREQVVADLRGRPQGWREVEVYGAIATPAARSALHDALGSDPDTRLHAAAALRDIGEDVDLAGIVAAELSRVTIGDGMVTALRLVERVPTREAKLVLLREALRRPEVGVHYAAELCFLTGVTSTSFDWDMRPFFLRFGEHAPESERQAAFEELCRLTGLRPD